jgi:hypothetical protein
MRRRREIARWAVATWSAMIAGIYVEDKVCPTLRRRKSAY